MIKKKEGENMKQDERLKDIPANSYFHDVLQRFCAHKPAMVSAFVLTLEIILVIALPYILHLDPYTSDYEVMFGSAPSAIHWLGTDDIGRDIFARFIYGGRVSLSVGIISAVISMAVGVPLGLLAGYYRGIAETLIMRCADVFMSFPAMVLILVLVYLYWGPLWPRLPLLSESWAGPSSQGLSTEMCCRPGSRITWRRPGPSAQRTALF